MSSVSSTTSTASTTYSSYTNTTSSSSSDIDWEALISLAVAAKTARADTIDLQVTENEAEISALTELQTALLTLEDAAQALRAPSGTLAAADDVFRNRAAYLTASDASDAGDVLGVTVDDGTELGTIEVAILQVAEAHKVVGIAQSSRSDDLALAGTIALGVDGGTTTSIGITETMSLADIAEAINTVADDTGVKATVIAISSTAYRLVLSSADTGVEIVASDESGSVLEDLGVIGSDDAFVDELQAPANAIMTVDGLTITRSSNTIGDVIDGVTFQLYGTTDDEATIAVEVAADLTSVKTAIETFVEAYNAVRALLYTHQQTTSGGAAADDAVLFGDQDVRAIGQRLASAMTSTIGDDGMALLGLSFDETNALALDEDTLDDALLVDYDAVVALLSFQLDSSSSDLRLLARGDEVPASFTLDVTVDEDGNLSAVTVDGETGLFKVSGTRIVGVAGTDYEGLSFVFTGDESQSIAITASTGIAERIHVVSALFGDADSGLLQSRITDLAETDVELAARAEDIRTRADDYGERLATRYAKIQAAIAEAESTLDYLEALLNAGDD